MMIKSRSFLRSSVLFFVIGLLAYGSWIFASIRMVDHDWQLIRHTLTGDNGWFVQTIVDSEIERRIRSGEYDGVMFVFDLLSIGLANERTKDLAEAKASELIGGVVDVNSRNSNGYTAVHLAVASNNPDVLQWLLENGADPTVKTDLGFDESEDVDAMQYLELVEEHLPGEDRAALAEMFSRYRE